MHILQKTTAFAILVALGTSNASAQAIPLSFSNCRVTLIEQARVPAEEQGVLTSVLVREGERVKAGAPLAEIDKDLAELQCNVAKYELDVAKKKAENKISVDYANASA
ncbi:MAG: biotin/lipoyl-binding protein, partial [Pirellulales bacterium]|nr:biotin/lipoyl-binding protein [Pirellulales bacterium]